MYRLAAVAKQQQGLSLPAEGVFAMGLAGRLLKPARGPQALPAPGADSGEEAQAPEQMRKDLDALRGEVQRATNLAKEAIDQALKANQETLKAKEAELKAREVALKAKEEAFMAKEGKFQEKVEALRKREEDVKAREEAVKAKEEAITGNKGMETMLEKTGITLGAPMATQTQVAAAEAMQAAEVPASSEATAHPNFCI